MMMFNGCTFEDKAKERFFFCLFCLVRQQSYFAYCWISKVAFRDFLITFVQTDADAIFFRRTFAPRGLLFDHTLEGIV